MASTPNKDENLETAEHRALRCSLEAAFDGSRLTSDGGLGWLAKIARLRANQDNALWNEHPDHGKQTDRDGNGGERSPEYLGFPAEKARGRGGEHQPLRREHAGLASRHVLHRRREVGRQAEAPRGLDL